MDLLILSVLLLNILITLGGVATILYLLVKGTPEPTTFKYTAPKKETTQEESADALDIDETVPLEQFNPDPTKPLKFVVKDEE